MWLCTSEAFLSIVNPAPHESEGDTLLLVRARVKGHIESVFPAAKVFRRPGRDYLYRAFIDRETVAAAVAEYARQIAYGNFKNSVEDDDLHDAFSAVWRVMSQLQAVKPYGSDSPAARRMETERAKRHINAHAAKVKGGRKAVTRNQFARQARTGSLFPMLAE